MLYNLSLGINPSVEYSLSYAYKPLPEAAQYESSFKCVLRVLCVASDGTETQHLHYIDPDDDIHKQKDGDLALKKISQQTMENGWVLQNVYFGFTGTDRKWTIDQVGFVAAIVSGPEHKEKVDLARLGMISISPAESTLDDETIHPLCFNWKNIRWEQTDKDHQLTFWGTLDWHWLNNRKNDEVPQLELEQGQLRQENGRPRWCQTDYALVYLTSLNGDDDIFLGTSFSSLFRISGVDLSMACGKRRIKVEMIDNLGHLQSKYIVDLPSIMYYT